MSKYRLAAPNADGSCTLMTVEEASEALLTSSYIEYVAVCNLAYVPRDDYALLAEELVKVPWATARRAHLQSLATGIAPPFEYVTNHFLYFTGAMGRCDIFDSLCDAGYVFTSGPPMPDVLIRFFDTGMAVWRRIISATQMDLELVVRLLADERTYIHALSYMSDALIRQALIFLRLKRLAQVKRFGYHASADDIEKGLLTIKRNTCRPDREALAMCLDGAPMTESLLYAIRVTGNFWNLLGNQEQTRRELGIDGHKIDIRFALQHGTRVPVEHLLHIMTYVPELDGKVLSVAFNRLSYENRLLLLCALDFLNPNTVERFHALLTETF